MLGFIEDRAKIWKKHMEKIMNEEDEWDQICTNQQPLCSAMLHLLQMGPSKVLTAFLSPNSELLTALTLGAAPCRITVTPSSDSSDMYTSTVQSGPPLLMQHYCPTLVSKPLIPHLPLLYLLPLPLTTVPCSCLTYCASSPPLDSLRVL